jgi:hypothetical protein
MWVRATAASAPVADYLVPSNLSPTNPARALVFPFLRDGDKTPLTTPVSDAVQVRDCTPAFDCVNVHFSTPIGVDGVGTFGDLEPSGSYMVAIAAQTSGVYSAYRTNDYGNAWTRWTSLEQLIPHPVRACGDYCEVSTLIVSAAPDAPRKMFARSRTRSGKGCTCRARRLDRSVEYDVESACAVLASTPDALRAMLLGLPDEWLDGREAPDAWSPYQVCGHLAHIEECDWMDRVRVIRAHGGSRTFDPVDREAGFAKYDGWSIAQVIDRFAETRHANLDELTQTLQPGDLDRRGVHPDFGEVTLAQLLATWVVHDLNHVNQIVKTMAKQYTDAVGPWRAFLPLLYAP